MKKYFYIALAVTIGLGMAACSGGDGTEEEGITALTLKVDKPTVEASMTDKVKFTVTDQNGKDVTHLDKLRIQDIETNEYFQPEWGFYEDRIYTVQARYQGVRSNEVKITAQNHKKYEKYYRRVAVYQMTDVKCVACPTLTTNLEELDKKIPGRMVRIAVHGGFKDSDPFQTPATAVILQSLQINQWPTAVIDLREKTTSSVSGTSILEMINNSRKHYFAACGIRFTSSVTDRRATIQPEITFDRDGEYSVGFGILTDNLQATQLGANADYRHNHTLRGISNVFGGAIGNQKAGTIWTPEAAFTADLPDDPIEDMSVIVFVLRNEGTSSEPEWYVNNIASCPVNGSVDYKLNE